MGYKTDFSDVEWEMIREEFPVHSTGRPKQYSTRAVMNAIRYQQHTGCQWDMLPNDFPPTKVVQHFFYLWRDTRLFEKIQQTLHQELRKRQGRKSTPSLGIIDAQSVKTVQKGGRVGLMPARKSRVEKGILSST